MEYRPEGKVPLILNYFINQIAIINITTILAAASTKGDTLHKQAIIDNTEDCM
jgi:hypothetical protein